MVEPSRARSRKGEILLAAEREFASGGYAGARIERIAASAGVNKQLLFHYFESKEGLFAAALRSILARLDGRPQQSEAPAEVIRRTVGDLVSGMRAVPGLVGIVADSRANPLFPPTALRLVRDWLERLVARLSSAVRDGQQRGYFRDDVEPGTVATIGVATALGLAVIGGGPAGDPEPNLEQCVTRLLVDHCAWR